MDKIGFKDFAKINQILLLSVGMAFSIVILGIRMKLHQEFFFIFLVWNLFLAIVPYIITSYISYKPNLGRFGLLFWFGSWILFLPNAPYIITDLVHLKVSHERFIWLDILMIISFAINGMALFLISVFDMKTLLKRFIPQRIMICYLPAIALLTAFGIYLGRFLRYNSWEIIQNPIALFVDIASILLYPRQNIEAWLFTLSFSIFIYIICLLFNNISLLRLERFNPAE